jgi:hypothetical protein
MFFSFNFPPSAFAKVVLPDPDSPVSHIVIDLGAEFSIIY